MIFLNFLRCFLLLYSPQSLRMFFFTLTLFEPNISACILVAIYEHYGALCIVQIAVDAPPPPPPRNVNFLTNNSKKNLVSQNFFCCSQNLPKHILVLKNPF